MYSNDNYVVIMAGGIGSRFWPVSRASKPKQFHDVMGEGFTMIQDTFKRFEGICPDENIYVVTNTAYLQLVKVQLPSLHSDQILLEPVPKNTAPCVAYALFKIYQLNPKANIVVTPADHLVTNKEEFQNCIRETLFETQKKQIIVTLGIIPTRPDSGYGYIEFAEKSFGRLNEVKSFTKKPNSQKATFFVDSGRYLWNSGVFIFTAQSMINAFEHYLPSFVPLFKGDGDTYFSEKEQDFICNAYVSVDNISIDYGIMEKVENAHVLKSDFGWSDLGTWKSQNDVSRKDSHNNTLLGTHLLYDTSDCIIRTETDKLVVVEGLTDYIVAENEGVLLICNKKNEQMVKLFLNDAVKSYGAQYQ